MAVVGILSIGLAVLTGCLLGIPAVQPLVASRGDAFSWWWVVLAVALGCVLLWPRLLNAIIARGLRLLRREPLEHDLSGRAVALTSAWFVAAWVSTGTGHLRARPQRGARGAARAAARHLRSAASRSPRRRGCSASSCPPGVGVRDGVLALLLVTLMPLPAATAVVVVARFLAVLADLLLAGGAWAWGRRHHLLGSTDVTDSAGPGDRGGAARLLRDHGQDARRGGPAPEGRQDRRGRAARARGRVARTGCARSTSAARPGSSPTSSRWPGRPPAGSTSTSRGSRRPGRASASGSTSGWPAARTSPSTTTRSTSRCSTTSTSTSSTPRPSSPTSTGCCARAACSTSASGTAGRWSSRTTGCRSCRGCPGARPTATCALTGKGDHYYERYYTPAGLRRLFAAYDVWDYTLPVLTDPVGLRRRRQRAGLGGDRSRRRPSGRPCRWCPPTCGRRSRVPPPPPGRRCASRRATWADGRRRPRARRAHLAPGAARCGRRHLPAGRGRPHQPSRRRAAGGSAGVPPTARSPCAWPPRPSAGEVTASAWGSGAAWLLERVPDLLGERDDPGGFVAHHPLVAQEWRRFPGWRVPRSGLVVQALVPVDHRAEGHRQGGLRGLPPPGAPVRRAGARAG